MPSVDDVNESCADAVIDFTIVVDGSGSVRPGAYQKSIDFVENFIAPFEFSPTKSRLTLAQFSVNTDIYTTFADNDADIDTALTTMRGAQMKKFTWTAVMLETMLETITTNSRPGMPQIAILLTDGESTNGLFRPDPTTGEDYNTAQAMHDAGVIVYAIGIGDSISLDELSEIASNPDQQYLYELVNFGALAEIQLGIASRICSSTSSKRKRRSSRPAVNQRRAAYFNDAYKK